MEKRQTKHLSDLIGKGVEIKEKTLSPKKQEEQFFLKLVEVLCAISERSLMAEDLGINLFAYDLGYMEVIENYTGQTFYLYDDTHIVYGDGADSLRLQFKINALHELYENDVLIIDTINNVNNWIYDTQVSESGFGIRVNRANLLDNTVYSANGLVPPSYNDTFGVAFKKDYVYKVQGRYGWDFIPDEIEEATIHLIKDYFSKDRAWRNKYIQNVQSFDWQFEYTSESYRGTGNLYVDQILSSYVVTQMVVI